MTTTTTAIERIQRILTDTAAAHVEASTTCAVTIARAAETITSAMRRGSKVLVFGNGGSAADSQHFAAEFVGRFMINRRAMPAMALTTDTSILTSVANDLSYDQVFSRQIEAIGRSGDIAFGITTSGRSPNVLLALRHAKEAGLGTIALVGRRADEIAPLCDITLTVPADVTARIQELHRSVLHVICELVEAEVGTPASI